MYVLLKVLWETLYSTVDGLYPKSFYLILNVFKKMYKYKFYEILKLSENKFISRAIVVVS